MRQFIVIIALGVLGNAHAVSAQQIGLPPRLSQPPVANPGQTVKQLRLWTTLFGGYDRNMIPPPVLAGPDVAPTEDNYTGRGEVGLGFTIARGTRSLELGGSGSLTTRPVITASASPGPLYGVDVDASFRTPLGPIGDSFVRLGASRNPFYSMGVFGGLQPGRDEFVEFLLVAPLLGIQRHRDRRMNVVVRARRVRIEPSAVTRRSLARLRSERPTWVMTAIDDRSEMNETRPQA